jgi:hypothetical protein
MNFIELINSIVNSLNTREMAIIILVIVFLIFIFSIKSTRKGVFDILRLFFSSRKLIIPFIGMTLYISLILYSLFGTGLLNISLIKEVFFWFVIGAIPLFYKTYYINKKYKNFFKNNIFEFASLTTVFSFIINFYNFNIIIELILLITIFILILLITVSKTDVKYNITKKFFNGILSLILLVLFIIFIRNLLINPNSFININTVIIFTLPAFLTITLLPYLYLFALYMEYDSFYSRLKVVVNDSKTYKYAFKIVLKRYNLDFFGLSAFISEFNISNIKKKEDIEKEMLIAEKRVIIKNSTDFTHLSSITLNTLNSAFNIFENKFISFYKQIDLKIVDNSTDSALKVKFYNADEFVGEIISDTTIERNIEGMINVSDESTIIAGQNAAAYSDAIAIGAYIFIDDNDKGEKMIIIIDFDPLYPTAYNITKNSLIIKQNPSA